MAELSALQCKLLGSAAELEAFVPAWEALWCADPEATPFQHPAWLLPWWRSFGEGHPGRELRYVVVSTAGDAASAGRSGTPLPKSAVHDPAVALLPFYTYPDPASGERQLLLLGAGTSDYLDGVFAPADTARRCRWALAGLEFLLAQPGWEVLHAAQLRPASPLLAAGRAWSAEARALSAAIEVPKSGRPWELTLWAAESTSCLPATPLSELPAKIRRNAMYYRNRAERVGELRLDQATEQSCIGVFEQLVALHTARWQAAGQPGVLADPAVLAHHRAALPRLARAGLLRLLAVRLGEETLGILYSLIDPPRANLNTNAPASGEEDRKRPAAQRGSAKGRTQYFYLPAFSPAHAELRPGTLLTALSIEHAACEGVTTIDLLRGDEPYKQLWHAGQTPTEGMTLRAVRSSAP